jgi:hypothetical protein
MSNFTRLAQHAYDTYLQRPGSPDPWNLQEALAAIMPFLQAHGGNLEAMPGLRAAFEQTEPHELQAMWAEYCHLGDLLYTLERELHR